MVIAVFIGWLILVCVSEFAVHCTVGIEGYGCQIWAKRQHNISCSKCVYPISQQGSDLRELRLTWKEMENLIFERFTRIFGDILEDFWIIFEELWGNWFVVRRRKNFHQ